jgi:hypothetical protein
MCVHSRSRPSPTGGRGSHTVVIAAGRRLPHSLTLVRNDCGVWFLAKTKKKSSRGGGSERGNPPPETDMTTLVAIGTTCFGTSFLADCDEGFVLFLLEKIFKIYLNYKIYFITQELELTSQKIYPTLSME